MLRVDLRRRCFAHANGLRFQWLRFVRDFGELSLIRRIVVFDWYMNAMYRHGV